jgi:hypothetical protein
MPREKYQTVTYKIIFLITEWFVTRSCRSNKDGVRDKTLLEINEVHTGYSGVIEYMCVYGTVKLNVKLDVSVK